MNKIEFKNAPDTSTPLSAENLNQIQDNIEGAIDNATGRISAIENKDIAQDTRMTSIENKDIEQDTRISAIETEIETEWIYPELTNSFTSYNSSSTPRYKSKLGIVYLEGAVRPTKSILMNATVEEMFALPSELRPTGSMAFVQQGSGTNKWLLTIDNSGVVFASRYSNSDTYDTVTTATWLSFTATFMI